MKPCVRQKKAALLARQRWQEARRALALAGMLTFVGVGALAQSYWDGGGSGNSWNTSGNWSPNGVPGAATNVILDNSFVATLPTITLDGNRQVSDLTIGTTNGFTIDDGSGSRSLTINGGDLIRTSSAAGTQTFDFTTLALGANTTFNIGGSGSLVINSVISQTGGGNKSLTKTGSGTVAFNNTGNSFAGGLNINAGTLLVGPASGNVGIAATGNSFLGAGGIIVGGGTLEIAPTAAGADFTGFSRSITNNGGIIKLNPNDEITGIMNAGTLTFGANGGTLDIAKQLSTTAGLGNVAVNSVSNTPAIISYGTIANTSGAGGWDTAGRELTVTNNTLSGTGHLQFSLSNGAMVNYRQTNFSGTLYFNGPSSGDASAGSTDTDVGRLLLNPSSGSTFQVAGGMYFDGYMQVAAASALTLDTDLTIRSGATAFQGQVNSDNDLTIGSSDTDTLRIKDDARAIMDVAFRTDNNRNGGVNLQSSTVIEAGGTLQFKRSNTSATNQINVSGNITGQGNSTNDSTVRIDTAATDGTGTAAGRTFFQSGVDLVVNGTDLGGLRIEGASTNVNALLTATRFQNLTGSGGTLTIAYTDSVTNTFNTDPTSPSDIKLGFDAADSSNPTYWLGSSANTLTTFAGLVVRGGNVVANSDQSFTGDGSTPTTLDMLGGTLTLKRIIPRTLTFSGDANLTGGTIEGGGGFGGSAGDLIIGGDINSDGTVLSGFPDITMTAQTSSTTNTLQGSTALTGVGTFTKGGDGTVVLEQQLGAVSINVQAGTLLLDSANRISDTVNMTLSGGTFATGGFNETLGALTLTANSSIDLGGGSSTLTFGDSLNWTTGTTLTIKNWNGIYEEPGGGTDQLYIGSISTSELEQIFFLNPAGFDPGLYPALVLDSGEIVPIPEPGTWLAIFGLVSAIGYRERRRLYTFTQMWFRRPSAK